MAGKAESRKRKSLMEKNNNFKSSKLSPANSQLLQAISNRRHAEVANLLESSLDQIAAKTLETALFQIVENGHKRLLQLFIKHGVNVNCKNTKGQTVLMVAAQHGCLDLVKLLVRNGADVNSKAKSGKTALILALEKACCVPIVEFLVSSNGLADVNIQDKAGRSALMVSTELCDIAAMRVLIHHGTTNFKIQDRKGNTALDIAKQNDVHEEFCMLQESNENQDLNPLMMSVIRGNLSLLNEFLDDDYYNIDEANLDGYTPLLLALKSVACECKDIQISKKIISTLLKSGADVNKLCMLNNVHTCTPLMFAVESGNLEAVILLVEHGANVNVQTPIDNLSALMCAAQKGFYCIVEYLLKKHADLHLKDAKGKVALSYALEKSEISCADLLIQHGAELDDSNLALSTSLDVELDKYLQCSSVAKQIASSKVCHILMRRCCDRKNYALAEFLFNHGAGVNCCYNSLLFNVITHDTCMATLLLDRGAKINEVNEHGYTALMMAAYRDCPDAVKLLTGRKADMNMDSNGSTALTLAIQQHSRSAVEALLCCGVDVNYVSQHPLSCKPLHMSISHGDNEITKLLIHFGADINSVDSKVQTPLLLAFKGENYEIIDLLIAKGVDLDKQTLGGCTVLHFALMSQNMRMTETLIRSGADVNVPDDHGKTALMICSQICTTDFMLLILKSGANVNAVDESGSPPLHHAVKHSILLTEKAELLLKHGADINKANNDGDTAFMIASRFCKDNVLKFLLHHGADQNAQDRFGSTALINALLCQRDSHRSTFLINIGADVNIKNNLGKTALIVAAEKCDDLTMKNLIAAGADVHVVNQATQHNVISLLIAMYSTCNRCGLSLNNEHKCTCKHYVCIEMLLDAGARPDYPYYSLIALYKAIVCRELKLVQLLVRCGTLPLQLPETCNFLSYSVDCDIFLYVYGAPWRNIYFNDSLLIEGFSKYLRSPLATALYCRNVDISEFFINSWFLHEEDMSRKSIRVFHDDILAAKDATLADIRKVLLKPWSLAALSFVTISTCVGSSNDREKRIRSLPIPLSFQEKLLYRYT